MAEDHIHHDNQRDRGAGTVNGEEAHPSANSRATTQPDPNMPIAIIGMSCRFPGDATSPERLWQMCAEGRSAWSTIPRDRWESEAFYHPGSYKKGSTNIKGGHFLKQDIALFDAPFFNISIEEAKATDPQLRILLECTYEALENAGLSIQSIANTPTSVYSGVFGRDYHEGLIRDVDTMPRYFNTGNGAAMFSNRLSYFFNLKGPSLTVDTGCSTSLVALHLGCQSLRAGESTMSIIGASNLIFRPDMTTAMTNFGFLGVDGKSYAFDHRALGYGRGEGVASLVLKPLKDALRDNDPIRAVIRTTGLNQDGRTNGITLPDPKAQEDLIRSCYENAGLDPADTPYVEAHGTGTIGDQLEASAISAVFSPNRTSDNSVYVASVKTNIGHTEATSGLAGIIKAVLALEKGTIPPSINFEKPHPQIPLEKLKIKIPTSPESWPSGACRRASVNSFGYGGTNGHVILEHVSSYIPQSKSLSNGYSIGNSTEDEGRFRVFSFSANDEETVREMLPTFASYLRQKQEEDPQNEEALLNNLAYTLAHRRSRFSWTAATPARTLQELVELIDSNKVIPSRRSEDIRLGFVFNGQGAQWYAMGRELLPTYPVFRSAIIAADKHMKTLGADWSILEELQRDEKSTRINAGDISQPICTAVQIALTQLLKSWNITPTAVTCHSSGEVAAAYAAGAISLESAITVSYYRGMVIMGGTRRFPDLKGGMAAVALSREETEAYIARVSSGKILAACINSPSSVTVSGDLAGIEELQALLEEDSVFIRRLNVDAGYHSHHMNVVADEYRALLGQLPTEDAFGDVAYWSSVTGERVDDGTIFGTEYWITNMIQPVLFTYALQKMCLNSDRKGKLAVDALVEIGPHSALAGPIRQAFTLPELKGFPIPYTSCLVRKQDAVRTMQELACTLYRIGYPVDLAAVNQLPHDLRVVTDLPSYPWNHKIRHWQEPRLSKEHRERKYGYHDLLGLPFTAVGMTKTWRHIIRPSDIPWVRDHIIQSDIVYPGAAYICMAIEAIRQGLDETDVKGYKLRDVNIASAVVVPDTVDGIELFISLSPCANRLPGAQTWREFHISSVSDSNVWTEHCTGYISIEYTSVSERSTSPSYKSKVDNVDKACVTRVESKDVYDSLHALGIRHGPSFQNLEEIRVGRKESIAVLSVADIVGSMPDRYEHDHVIHPTTLDTVFQAMHSIIAEEQHAAMIPKFVRSIFLSSKISRAPGHRFKVCSEIQDRQTQSIKASILVANNDGADSDAVIEVDGLVCGSIGMTASQDSRSEKRRLCFQMRWAPDISFPLSENFQSSVEEKSLTGQIRAQVATLVDLYAHKYPGANILGVRAGRSCCTLPVLKTLGPQSAPRFSHYDVTDVTNDLLEDRRSELEEWGDLVDFKLLDIDIDPGEQTGIQCNSYDLVIVDQALNNVKQADTALLNIRKLLNDNGKVLIVDANDNYRSRDEWNYLLRQNGYDGLDQYLTEPPVENGLPPQFGVILGSVKPDSPLTAAYPKISILYGSETPPESWIQELVRSIASLTNAVPEIERLDQGIQVADDKLYVCIAELARPILSTIDENTFTILRSLLTSAKAVLWATRGGAVDCEVPEASLVTGLLRTLRNENPSTQYLHVDVDPAEPSWSFATVDFISKIARRMLCGDFQGDSEYAQRNGHIMIPRVIEDGDQNTLIYTQTQSPIPTTQPFYQSGRPLRMEVGTRGLLDSLRFVDDPIATTPLPNDFVEIEPKAFGLNFRDIMVAMGQLNEMIMGYECSGVITKIGSGVSGLKVGERVIGLTRGHYANILRMQGRNVIPISDDISFETAASIPIVFATAYYSLYECARLRKGETVLIHAAAGGVGQAAIMLAQLAEAEIFATVGTNEKKDFLVSTYGIPADHIFSSRSIAFAKQILSATSNKGVDVILNCLAGEILHESWNCIAALGRFVEIGKRDFELNNHLEMRPFTRNVAFFSVDLTYLLREKSQVLTEILTDVIKLLREKRIDPVRSITVFPIAEVERAFRLMQAGKHRGKVIIQPNQGDYVKALPAKRSARFRDDGSYLIVGGAGGIGRSVSLWMAKNGAKHLIILSRRGKTRSSRELLAKLRDAGCETEIYSCDVADKAQLEQALQQSMKIMPPIRGVIQAAMVLKDSIFAQMPYESYVQSLRPKVQGTWNLHELLSKTDLDFFVMLSSGAGVFGNGGQANYAAGSTFLDAIARHRTSLGLPAVALDLGVIESVGYVAQNRELAARLERQGHIAIRENELLLLIQSAIMDRPQNVQESQTITGLAVGQDTAPWLRHDAKFSLVRMQQKASSPAGTDEDNEAKSLQNQLSRVESRQDAIDIICKAITIKLSNDFMIAESDINPDASLSSYGVDSLVAVELRNWILTQARAEISIFDVLQSKSLVALAEKVAVKSGCVDEKLKRETGGERSK